MTKKRTKKHNIHKRFQRVAEASFHNHVMAFATNQGQKVTNLVKLPEMRLVKPTRYEADTFTKNPFQWTVHLAGFGRKENGTEYMEYEIIRTSGAYIQDEIVDYLDDRHRAFIRGMNQNRLVGAGWVASMSGRMLTETELILLFNKLNAWG